MYHCQKFDYQTRKPSNLSRHIQLVHTVNPTRKIQFSYFNNETLTNSVPSVVVERVSSSVPASATSLDRKVEALIFTIQSEFTIFHKPSSVGDG